MKLHRRTLLSGSLGASLAGMTAQGPARSNEAIERARDVALEILKPSRKELEHGLDLHRNSLVFEAYGFAPRSALDGAAIRAAMEGGASDIELQDLREEMGMTRCVTAQAERVEFQEAWKAAGVTCIFQNCGEEGQGPLVLLKRLAPGSPMSPI